MAISHPKIAKLREVVLEHFQRFDHKETRIIIFSQYRNSVCEIAAVLHAHKPIVRVMEFVGQSDAEHTPGRGGGKNGEEKATKRKGKKGLTQKEQMEVVRRFRDGGYNVLVATCVGEEGLDIGEVDLIICFDVSKSPIRMVQRMGRTGRKRDGRIVVLVTQGKEEGAYLSCLSNKKSISKAIVDKNKLRTSFVKSPRMVPRGVEPEVRHLLLRSC